jgi:hypothetical protein
MYKDVLHSYCTSTLRHYVEGESGIGKTTLVNEVISIVREADMPIRVLSVSADSMESHSQYAVVRGLVRQLLEVDKLPGVAQETTSRRSFDSFDVGGSQSTDSQGIGTDRSAALSDKLVAILSAPEMDITSSAVSALGNAIHQRSKARSRSEFFSSGGDSPGVPEDSDNLRFQPHAPGQRRHMSMVERGAPDQSPDGFSKIMGKFSSSNLKNGRRSSAREPIEPSTTTIRESGGSGSLPRQHNGVSFDHDVSDRVYASSIKSKQSKLGRTSSEGANSKYKLFGVPRHPIMDQESSRRTSIEGHVNATASLDTAIAEVS